MSFGNRSFPTRNTVSDHPVSGPGHSKSHPGRGFGARFRARMDRDYERRRAHRGQQPTCINPNHSIGRRVDVRCSERHTPAVPIVVREAKCSRVRFTACRCSAGGIRGPERRLSGAGGIPWHQARRIDRGNLCDGEREIRRTPVLHGDKRLPAAILALRSTDGIAPPPPPFVGVLGMETSAAAAGVWRPTPLLNATGAGPQFATMTPWVLTRPSQFRLPPPNALASPEYAADYNEIKSMGVYSGSSAHR